VEYVLKISLGAPLLNLILISTLGSALGISAGVLIGSLVKNQKYMVVVPLCFSMASSFCSGLMWHQIKQIIESNVPIINRINPASLLTDCFYVRATYGKTEMYYQDIRTMCLLIVGCLLISGLLLRRRKYGSL
jgi:ABC-2 type transport system permease protein